MSNFFMLTKWTNTKKFHLKTEYLKIKKIYVTPLFPVIDVTEGSAWL